MCTQVEEEEEEEEEGGKRPDGVAVVLNRCVFVYVRVLCISA